MRNLFCVLSLLLAPVICVGADRQGPSNGHYIVVVGMASEAKIAAGSNAVVIIGALREDRLRATLDKLNTADVKGVISFGVAGGLDPTRVVGDVIVPNQVVFQGHSYPTSKELSAALRSRVNKAGLRSYDGTIAGVEVMGDSSGEWRTKFRKETKGDAVDMETHIAADFAARHGLPFAALRSLSDAMGDSFPSAARAPLDENGEVQTSLVVGEIFKNPFQIGQLMTVGKNFSKAKDVLLQVRTKLDGMFGR